MLEWEFRDPWFFVLLVLAPIVYWLASRATSLLCYSSRSIVEGMPRSLRQRLVNLPAWLLALGTAALVVSLARPRTPQVSTKVSSEGIAIMMLVDLSSSMNARDLVEEDRSVDRLDVVKDVFEAFVLGGSRTAGKGRPDDLVGLITFAGYADSICPLTLDHGNLTGIVDDLQIVSEQSEDGTAIGDGLGLAVERLRRSKARSRVAILLTDGVNNAGVIQPIKAAELAADNDIKVYCIGAGTNGMAPIPATDMFGRTVLVSQQVRIDEKTLKQIADETGGEYFRAENKEALARIYAEIDELERTEVSEIRYLQYTEHFGYFVASGMGLIGLASLLAGSIFRKLP